MSCLSCCKRVDKETEINNVYSVPPPQYEQMRIRVLDFLEKLNVELDNPKYHEEGVIYNLSFDVLINPSNSPYLLKKIVMEHYHNNLLKVSNGLIDQLENMCCVIKSLQQSNVTGKR